MKKETKETPSFTKKVLIVLLIFFVLSIFSSCSALLFIDDIEEQGNVAIIPLSGVIVSSGSSFSGEAPADDVVALLKQARDNNKVQAVILEINSPGGSPVASDEIASAVREVQEQNKTVVAWMREVGASGAYWIAASADTIIANKMTITGSIGVVGNYFGFEEFLDEYNVSYRRFTGGERKDIGNPFRAMTLEEQEFMQEKIDAIHEIFIQEVAMQREMHIADVRAVATGEFFLGFEALEVGLVDSLGGYNEALAYVEEKHNITAKPFRLEKHASFFEQLASIQIVVDTPTNMQTGMRI